MNQQDIYIRSVDMVQRKLEMDDGLVTKNWDVRKIMRDDMLMRYRKILPISTNANLERNLVLR